MLKNKLFESYYDWWKNIDKIILLLILSLFLLGLFFSFVSTSIIASDKLGTNSYYFFLKHFVFICVGISLLFLISFIERDKLIYVSLILFLICTFFLILVPFFGVEVKGSKRWLNFGFLPRFQPIEILKPFIIITIGFLLTLKNIKNLYVRFILSFIIILPIILLLMIQPDIGQSILVIIVWLSLIFISGVNLFLFFSSFFILGGFVSYLIIYIPKFSYIKLRLISFLNPSSGNSYQSDKASEAIINGGLFGKGIGEGTLNTKVPEAHTDYIISVISEEFGAISIILIMLIYLFLSFKVMKIIDKEDNNLIKLILLGCVVLILMQTFIHVGVNIRILPTTGMTLPYLSNGGSSIISTAIISGIILNFTKEKLNINEKNINNNGGYGWTRHACIKYF